MSTEFVKTNVFYLMGVEGNVSTGNIPLEDHRPFHRKSKRPTETCVRGNAITDHSPIIILQDRFELSQEILQTHMRF
jgi:hypothetical protein